jgi:long-chain acyl-CoA synthetase
VHPGLWAERTPDKPALVMGETGVKVSYRELDEASNRLAQLLYARGLRTGDGVALLAENHPRYFEVYWAAVRSGLYVTAISRHLPPDEAAYLVNDSGADAFVTTRNLAPTAVSMLPLLTGAPVRLMMDGIPDNAAGAFGSYEEAVAGQPAMPLPDAVRGDVMLYSSGTTGRPKGIRRPLTGLLVDNPAAVGVSSLERGLLGMSETSVYLCPAPLYHAAALQWSAGVHEMGGTVVVMEKFDALQFLRLVERERVTHSQVVPTMLVRMLKLPDTARRSADLSSLECIVHAAAPCPPDVKRQVIEWMGPIVSEYYAGTEGSGLTFLTAEQWLEHPGSVGRPVVGIPHICDEEGREVETGQVGAIYFEREVAAFEYHQDEGKTRDSRHPQHDNWSTFGDIGYLDVDGYLYLTDRRAFTIISGGVNIYPAEIESCLIMHPAVADVAVFGIPDPEMGDRVIAVVQLAAGVDESDVQAEALRTFAREHLAGYKVPRVVHFRAQLPRLATGKLVKGQLRDEYAKLET